MRLTPLKLFVPIVAIGAMTLGGSSCSKPETEVEKAERLYEDAQKQVEADSIKYLEYNPNAVFYKAQADSMTRDRDNFVQRVLNNMKEMDYDDYEEFLDKLADKEKSIAAAKELVHVADGTKYIHSTRIRHLAYRNLLTQRMVEKSKNNKYFKKSIKNIQDSIREQSIQTQK